MAGRPPNPTEKQLKSHSVRFTDTDWNYCKAQDADPAKFLRELIESHRKQQANKKPELI